MLNESLLPVLFAILVILGLPTMISQFWAVRVLRNRYPDIIKTLTDNDSIAMSGMQNSWRLGLFFFKGQFHGLVHEEDLTAFLVHRFLLIVYMISFAVILPLFMAILAA